MKSLIAVVFSLLCMFALTLFLSFAAVFVCDGYYPVGWNWKGSALHIAFWAMPVSVLVGSIAASLAILPRISVVLLLLGTVPFIAAVSWRELQMAFSSGGQRQSPWLCFWLLAVMISIASDMILIRRVRAAKHCASQVGTR